MVLMMPLLTPIVSAGTPFAGWVYDDTGSYTGAFAAFVLLAVLSLVALWRVQLPEEPAAAAAAPYRPSAAH